MNELQDKKEKNSDASESRAWSFSLFSDSSTVLNSNSIDEQEKKNVLVENNNSDSVF